MGTRVSAVSPVDDLQLDTAQERNPGLRSTVDSGVRACSLHAKKPCAAGFDRADFPRPSTSGRLLHGTRRYDRPAPPLPAPLRPRPDRPAGQRRRLCRRGPEGPDRRSVDLPVRRRPPGRALQHLLADLVVGRPQRRERRRGRAVGAQHRGADPALPAGVPSDLGRGVHPRGSRSNPRPVRRRRRAARSTRPAARSPSRSRPTC